MFNFYFRSAIVAFVSAIVLPPLSAIADSDARNQVGVDPFDPTTRVYLSPSGVLPHGDGLFTVIARWETESVVQGIGFFDSNGAYYLDKSYSYNNIIKTFFYDCKAYQYGLVSEDYFFPPKRSAVFSETVDEIVMYDLTHLDPLVSYVCG